MSGLTGKSIVLTGGGAGIGFGILRQCIAAGAEVTVFDVNPEHAARVGAEGGHFVQLDVGDPLALQSAAQQISKCDGLVNNAGITIQKPLSHLTLADMELLWAVNQRAVLLLCQALAPKMAEGGAIVNVASNHAKASAAGYEAYAGTKGAIVAMTRALAWSLGPQGIRVNALAPGLTMTETVQRAADATPGLSDTFDAWHASGTPASVDEIGKVAVYLLSDASAALTGSEIIADHGMSARLGALT